MFLRDDPPIGRDRLSALRSAGHPSNVRSITSRSGIHHLHAIMAFSVAHPLRSLAGERRRDARALLRAGVQLLCPLPLHHLRQRPAHQDRVARRTDEDRRVRQARAQIRQNPRAGVAGRALRQLVGEPDHHRVSGGQARTAGQVFAAGVGGEAGPHAAVRPGARFVPDADAAGAVPPDRHRAGDVGRRRHRQPGGGTGPHHPGGYLSAAHAGHVRRDYAGVARAVGVRQASATARAVPRDATAVADGGADCGRHRIATASAIPGMKTRERRWKQCDCGDMPGGRDTKLQHMLLGGVVVCGERRDPDEKARAVVVPYKRSSSLNARPPLCRVRRPFRAECPRTDSPPRSRADTAADTFAQWPAVADGAARAVGAATACLSSHSTAGRLCDDCSRCRRSPRCASRSDRRATAAPRGRNTLKRVKGTRADALC
eukprot:ctg_300.g82